MLTEKNALFAVLTSAIAPILPLYTISLGPLYHEILPPPLLKYKLAFSKDEASKYEEKGHLHDVILRPKPLGICFFVQIRPFDLAGVTKFKKTFTRNACIAEPLETWE